MAPSLRSSAKVPRRAARLATARIEQSSLKYKLLIRQSQWPSSGDLSSQRGVQPSNLQHATQKVPRPTGDSSTQKVPKAVGSHLENSDDDVDVPAQSSKKPKSQESPDRVLQQPVLKSDTEYSDDVDDLVQSRNAKLQKLRDTVPKKPMSKSDAEESDDVDDLAQSKKPGSQESQKVPRKTVLKSDTDDVAHPTHSKKAKLQKSCDRGPQKTVLKSDTEYSDDVDDPTHCKKVKLQKSSDRGPRKTVLKSDTENSDDVDDPTHCKKAKLQKSSDRGPRKTVLKSDTEDSDDIDDPTHSKKAKLQKSCDRGPRKTVLKSDTEDSDDVDDPTHSEEVKSKKLPDQVPRKPTLRSINRANRGMQLRQPGKVDLKRSSRLAGKLKEPQNTCLQCKHSLGETAQTSKGHRATFKPISSSSGIIQQRSSRLAGKLKEPQNTCLQSKDSLGETAQTSKVHKATFKPISSSGITPQAHEQVPAGIWHSTTMTIGLPLFRKPDGKTRNRQYKCSVKGCPHTSNDHIGFWLFSLPDEEDEASLHSAWLQSVPIDLDINRPLSPRVCFKHFDVKKDFVSVCKRMVGLKPTAVPSKVPRKGHQSQSMTAAEATQKLEFTIDTDVGRGSQTTTATDRGNELESTTVVAMNHESRPTTGAGKGQESEPVSIVGTAQESQTMTAASMDSESQCTSAITSPPELASDSNSKSAAESWPTLQASPAQLTGENSGAGQLKKDDVCASPVSGSTESTEAAKHCPTVITESLLQTEDTNTGTCEPLASDSDSKKCGSTESTEAAKHCPTVVTESLLQTEDTNTGTCEPLASDSDLKKCGSTESTEAAKHCPTVVTESLLQTEDTNTGTCEPLASDSDSKKCGSTESTEAAKHCPTVVTESLLQTEGTNTGTCEPLASDSDSEKCGSTESTKAAKHCPTVVTESLLQTEDTNTGTCEPLASDSDSEKCGSTESTKAAKHCPTIVTESLLQTEGPNTGTCEPLVSDSDSEKCALESVPMQATNGSKPEEQKRDGACSLASHGPVDDAGSTTASHCASPEGNRDSDVDSNVCGLPKCVPKKMCDALTQPVLVTDNETQDAMLSKLQIDLEAPPQVSKDAVASSVSVQMCSTNKRADASNDRMDKEGMKITTERHNLDPQHVKSDHKSDASITAIRTAAKVHPTLDAPTKPLLRKEVTVSNVAMLSRGPSNLVHSINSEMKRNEQDGICKSRLPNFFSQSYGSDRRDDRHVSSHAFNLPVVKAAVDAKSWPNVSEEPSASCSAIVRHRPDFPGGSSTDEAEKSKPTNPATASHLFDPSQGRYVLKKEVLQDGDELGMSAVLCTVVWVPKGGAN
ncbi:uncharacterized protein LOC119463412 isoform X5 [Dermacentor silvarum]|uniref:uncharacterized protein LOC119463412 isoform X5 n=1 Tax=Dermacentor silvarum TaxID=543639 RepID=UPI0021017848|nr:uncharacterized protein LOC119463412 isoform X5 [Dermacentor silvarum]